MGPSLCPFKCLSASQTNENLQIKLLYLKTNDVGPNKGFILNNIYRKQNSSSITQEILCLLLRITASYTKFVIPLMYSNSP